MEKDLKIKLSQEELAEKIGSSKFWYYCSKVDENPSLIVKMCEFLFGEKQTEEIFDKYEKMEDVTNFLLGFVNSTQSSTQSMKESTPENISPEITE